MTHQRKLDESQTNVTAKPAKKSLAKETSVGTSDQNTSGINQLQNQLGNQAVQRLLAQRSDDAPTDLDDATAERINRARGGGQSLDSAVQAQMSEALGQDFSGVQVHTSAESHDLNQQLGAKAFTTGQDIFFREGEYQPQSSSGQELIAHELTHVVQQSTGAVGDGGSGMTVNAPGDRFEQEADAVAKQVTAPTTANAEAGIQRQEAEEEELQMQALDEEEEVQMQELDEEEDMVQQQALDEEELAG